MKFFLILLAALSLYAPGSKSGMPIDKTIDIDKFSFRGDIRYWNNTAQKELLLYFKDGETGHYLFLQQVSMPYEFPNGYYTLSLDENTLQIQTRFGTTYYFAMAGGTVKQSENYAKENKHMMADLGVTAFYHFSGAAGTYKTIDEIKEGYASAYEYFVTQ